MHMILPNFKRAFLVQKKISMCNPQTALNKGKNPVEKFSWFFHISIEVIY